MERLWKNTSLDPDVLSSIRSEIQVHVALNKVVFKGISVYKYTIKLQK